MHCFYFKLLLICSFAALSQADDEIDWCNKTLCPYQGPHVRCDNNGGFSENCEWIYNLEDMEPYVDLIMNEHNKYRNKIASGEMEGFDPAVRMPAIKTWNTDLAVNSQYNVKSCVFAHDKCRSTPHYHYAGQNIFYAKTSNLSTSIEDFVKEACAMWFNEYKYADANLMQDYHKTGNQTGHFTVLVNDRQTAVGCACLNNLINTKKGWRRIVLVTCDYPSNNIHGLPTYKSGPTASKCRSVDPEFPALCANDDDWIDPNNIYWYFED